jgi:hypothetical protein
MCVKEAAEVFGGHFSGSSADPGVPADYAALEPRKGIPHKN